MGLKTSSDRLHLFVYAYPTSMIRRFLELFKRTSQRLLMGELRFAPTLLALIISRTACAAWLYSRLMRGGQLQTAWRYEETPHEFLRLFTAWDSGFPYALAQHWYPELGLYFYACWPSYPLLVRISSVVTGNYLAATVIPALVLGVVWIPVFQAVAEHYMSRAEAVTCTLCAGFFPYVFVFTSVAYTEPLFLFTGVTSWLLYLRGRTGWACVLAAIASVTRSYGILLTLPIFCDLLRRSNWRQLPYLFLPLSSVFGWLSYCYLTTGDWLVYLRVQMLYWDPKGLFFKYMLPSLTGHFTMDFESNFILAFTLLMGFLAFRVWELDWRLAIYSTVLFTSLLFTGYVWSYPRFLSFIFPLWLSLRVKNPLAVACLCLLFYLAAAVLWYQFLTSRFLIG